MPQVELPFAPTRSATPLANELRSFSDAQTADWDAQVAGTPPGLPGGSDLWGGMPAVDSKVVARASPIFKKHLGIDLDLKLIRRGGYRDVEDMISHLEPAMRSKAASTSGGDLS